MSFKRAQAIRIVEKSKHTHVVWAAYWKEMEALAKNVGDRKFHEKVIREYDQVLKFLRG